VTDERALSQLLRGELDRMDVTGPFQRLQIELEKPGAARQRRGRRIFMTRNRLVLLAAALVLLLGVGVFVSARALSELNKVGSPNPAGPVDKVAVAKLLALPLQFKPLAAGQPCPQQGPVTRGLLGSGPVFGQGAPVDYSTTWGAYTFSEFVITPPGLVGPVVLRAENLRTGSPGVFVGPYAAGPVEGTDKINGKSVNQYTAAALDTDHPPKTSFDFGSPYVQWTIEQGWPHSSGFCAGLQINGPAFTEVIYADVGPG
jgi:hypothetical protein